MFQHTATAEKPKYTSGSVPTSLTRRHVPTKFPVYFAPAESGKFMPDSQINVACA